MSPAQRLQLLHTQSADRRPLSLTERPVFKFLGVFLVSRAAESPGTRRAKMKIRGYWR